MHIGVWVSSQYGIVGGNLVWDFAGTVFGRWLLRPLGQTLNPKENRVRPQKGLVDKYKNLVKTKDILENSQMRSVGCWTKKGWNAFISEWLRIIWSDILHACHRPHSSRLWTGIRYPSRRKSPPHHIPALKYILKKKSRERANGCRTLINCIVEKTNSLLTAATLRGQKKNAHAKFIRTHQACPHKQQYTSYKKQVEKGGRDGRETTAQLGCEPPPGGVHWNEVQYVRHLAPIFFWEKGSKMA